MTAFAFDQPDAALRAWADRVAVIRETDAAVADPIGRVTAADASADRDSPAADVSAMDGFAVRGSDLENIVVSGASDGFWSSGLPIRGECAAGTPRQTLPDVAVLKIFTGGVLPSGADAVIRVEDTEVRDGAMHVRCDASIGEGQHIRRRGENTTRGQNVVPGGTLLTAASIATLANFGASRTPVHRKVRVALITTGGEVLPDDASPEPHQLRNSNAAAISALLATHPWIELDRPMHCEDDPTRLAEMLRGAASRCDAVITTGGVSMGDHDYVPAAVQSIGAEIVFHKLPIRPGKPLLAAVTDEGVMVGGLPGNPVSAVVNTRRMMLPMLRRIAGIAAWLPSPPLVAIKTDDPATMPLHQMRLVRLDDSGEPKFIPSKGSGDLVALGKSDGFVEIPAGQTTGGHRRFWCW